MRAAVAAGVLLWVVTSGCGSCGQEDDNRLEVYVDALIAEPGVLADEAGRALTRRGRDAIVILETGLYRAEPDARRRIIRVLVDIGDRAALPILEHLAAFDADAEVRVAASRGLERLNARPARESK